MIISETEFNSLTKESQFELLNNYGLFVGNRLYYNHRINLYSINKFFVEVHYEPNANQIDKIEAVSNDWVNNGYWKQISLNL